MNHIRTNDTGDDDADDADSTHFHVICVFFFLQSRLPVA